jgi:succinate dehydrogenase/fumarate reductase flavoprotein subunit
MSHISDPDRLERFARYVMDDPPNVTPVELSAALGDAAARIRDLQERLEEARLHVIEARNPGIDMDEVRRLRSVAVLKTDKAQDPPVSAGDPDGVTAPSGRTDKENRDG